MASENSFSFPAALWLPASQWAGATDGQRGRYLRRVGELAQRWKRDELRKGVGVDGDRLAPVAPSSRPDGATGKPLDPHYGESRSVRWLRFSVGERHVTLHWSHGFGRILGYHARGQVRGAPARDVIGLTAADTAKLKAEARRFWRAITGRGPARPADLRGGPPPHSLAAAAPKPAKVVYLRPGERAKAFSRRIQVGE